MAKVVMPGDIVKSSIITAFTLVLAFVWKDFIAHILVLFFPNTELFSEFISAVITTVIVVFLIWIILRTESEAELVIRKLKRQNKKK